MSLFPQITRYYRLHRRDLVYLKFVMEAYEGLTTLSTIDKAGVIVSITYGADVRQDAENLISAMCGEIALTEVCPDTTAIDAVVPVVAAAS